MTKEDLVQAYAAENHHLMYDLDPDSDPAGLLPGPADDGTEHCISPVRTLPESTL